MKITSSPARKDVPENLQWDLSTIFSSEAEFKAEFSEVSALIPEVKKLNNIVNKDAAGLLETVESVLNVSRRYEKVFVYAHLNNDVDTSNNKYQGFMDQVTDLGTKLSAAISWFEPEVIKLGEKKINEFTKQLPDLNQYQRFFASILKNEGHVLSVAEEKLLSKASGIFGAPEKIFSSLDSSDLEFPMVEDGQGNQVRLTNGIYGVLLQSTDREVRAAAFKKLYQVYRQFKNTLASTLSSEVAVNNFNAEVHHFDSARNEALHSNEVDPQVFDNLIKSVNDHLPLLHRYVALRKKILNLPEMHMYDMYVPLAKEPEQKYTFDDSKKIMLDALNVLGPDYIGHVQDELNNRWIDVVENQGKRTGAYSSGMYDTNPYILLNWQDNMDNLYTLIHETGHSMHSYYTTHNQPYQYGDYSIFVAEIASTTNENILTNYLLENTQAKEMKKYILSSYLEGFKGTIFRQTQFAEFEQWIHTQAQAGEPLTAETMSQKYLEINQKYYGPDMEVDSDIALEWSRIPHFYYDFYVYQYATGFAAASTLADKISFGSEEEKNAYLNYLKAGSSDIPTEIMKKAGIDMTSVAYLDAAFAKFEQRMDELEKLM
ncbi:oligoendopeptidase F [Fructilactobacillus vespulae]|uniref:oligoendopeptidase F n=1 Tax=Fructilactobacillus vespulae TaxID=1249630 RepID=UPI0039B4918C